MCLSGFPQLSTYSLSMYILMLTHVTRLKLTSCVVSESYSLESSNMFRLRRLKRLAKDAKLLDTGHFPRVLFFLSLSSLSGTPPIRMARIYTYTTQGGSQPQAPKRPVGVRKRQHARSLQRAGRTLRFRYQIPLIGVPQSGVTSAAAYK